MRWQRLSASMHLLLFAFLLLLHGGAWAATVYQEDERSSIDPTARRSTNDGVPVRVCLVGDSIVVGFMSYTFDGYRQKLLDLLLDAGRDVDFIGSQHLHNTTKIANHFEAWPAHRVVMLLEKLQLSNVVATQQPNVIIILSGTNDVLQEEVLFSPEEPRALARYRLQIMLEWFVCVVPDAVLLVSTLPPLRNQTAHALALDFNAALPGIVAAGVAEGHKLAVVELHDLAPEFMSLDGVHPNDPGYEEVARRYAEAVLALPEGWLVPTTPYADVDTANATASRCAARVPSATTCPKCEGIWNCMWAWNETRCGSYD